MMCDHSAGCNKILFGQFLLEYVFQLFDLDIAGDDEFFGADF